MMFSIFFIFCYFNRQNSQVTECVVQIQLRYHIYNTSRYKNESTKSCVIIIFYIGGISMKLKNSKSLSGVKCKREQLFVFNGMSD